MVRPRQMHRHSFSVALALSLVAPPAALAQEAAAQEEVVAEGLIEETSVGETVAETAYPGWRYPKAYAQRPLVMRQYMARGTFSVDVKKVGVSSVAGVNEALAALDFGAAFAPLDNLEVGISNYRPASSPPIPGHGFFPIVVSPSGGFGDMPAYVRYSFLHRRYVEMGFDFVFVIPSRTRLATTFGLPVRIRARPKMTVDTGMELTILVENVGVNVVLPVKATYNITTSGFFFGESGITFENLGRNNVDVIASRSSVGDSNVTFPVDKNQMFVPVSIGGGYTVVFKGKAMMDFYARFGWNPLVYINPPTGVDVVPVKDTWFLGVGTIVQSRRVIDKKGGDS